MPVSTRTIPDPEAIAQAALGAFYGACDVVLSPSPATDQRLTALGIAATGVGRWDRGVDVQRFDPRLRDERLLPGEITVLYCGRLTREKGVDLLADAFLAARAQDPRLHLVLAGGGPEDGSGGNQGGDDDRRDPDSEAGEVEPRCPDDVVGWRGAGFGGHVVVVPSVLVVGDDEQALLPDGLVAAQRRVDVVDKLFAHGQI